MESVWDIYYAVLKDGSLKLDQYTERLFGAATKKTDKTLFLVLRFLIATTPFVVVVVVFFCGLVCFVVFSYPVRQHFTCYIPRSIAIAWFTLSHSL